MTDSLHFDLLFLALIIIAVVIWQTAKKVFRIPEESLRLSNKATYTIIVLLILLTRPAVWDWINEQLGSEETLTEQQKDMKRCDTEGRRAAGFSFWDREAELRQKEGIYLTSFLECTKMKGYHHITEKDVRIIELVNDPFWKR